jgi:hypothetical protein
MTRTFARKSAGEKSGLKEIAEMHNDVHGRQHQLFFSGMS